MPANVSSTDDHLLQSSAQLRIGEKYLEARLHPARCTENKVLVPQKWCPGHSCLCSRLDLGLSVQPLGPCVYLIYTVNTELTI